MTTIKKNINDFLALVNRNFDKGLTIKLNDLRISTSVTVSAFLRLTELEFKE